MHINIIKGPGAAAAHLLLSPGEMAYAESGSMVAMDGEIKVKTSTREGGQKKGGIMKVVKRLLAGESLFINEFKAGDKGGLLLLAPQLSGDLVAINLTETGSIIAQGGSFLAYEDGVAMEMSFQGAKNLFSGEGLFWLRFTGEGKTVLNAFGAIYQVEVDGEYVVDSGHVVAFTDTLTYKVSRSAKGIGAMFLSGEGLVMRFTGKGLLWCQSHHATAFGKILGPHLRPA